MILRGGAVGEGDAIIEGGAVRVGDTTPDQCQGADSVNDTEGGAVGVGVPIIEGRETDDEIYVNIWEFAAGRMTNDELDFFLDEAAKCKATRHCNCPYCSDPQAHIDGPVNWPIEYVFDVNIPNPHDPNDNRRPMDNLRFFQPNPTDVIIPIPTRMSEMIDIFDFYDEEAEREWAERNAVDDAVAEREAAEREWAERNHACDVVYAHESIACDFDVSVSRTVISEPDSDHLAGYISNDYPPSPSPDSDSQLPVNENVDVGGGG